MMKTVRGKGFFNKKDINQILDKIEKDKPGHELLTENQKKSYKKNIEVFLMKKFKDRAPITKRKLTDIILEHFLNQTYPNSEYDLLLFLKVCVQDQNLSTLAFNLQDNSTILQFEVKAKAVFVPEHPEYFM